MSRNGTLNEDGMFMPDQDCPICGNLTFCYNKKGEYLCNYCSNSSNDKPKKSKRSTKSKILLTETTYTYLYNLISNEITRLRNQLDTDTVELMKLEMKFHAICELNTINLKLPDNLKMLYSQIHRSNTTSDHIKNQITQYKERILVNQMRLLDSEKQLTELESCTEYEGSK